MGVTEQALENFFAIIDQQQDPLKHLDAKLREIAEHTDPNGDGPLGEACQREHAGDSSAAPAKFLENRNEKYAESIVYTPHDSKDQG